ncbi:actinodin2 [Periophthalmus magnuspinnatus]|uniref:actinodin2 n=1 Tax=Periophthalmus magnuspinnatus TaxID=409849 RepID=UPI00243669F9|nr:actinodin2 [Periophthalmus magnuspinnatus]
MAQLSAIHTIVLLGLVVLPELLRAVPVKHEAEQVPAVSEDVKEEVLSNLKKLVRDRRHVPGVFAVPQFKRLPDFWGWYKYFMDTHNQEGVEDLDRLYVAYLQNKHRSEEGPTFNHYLAHLSEIYKNCANSDDPECIAESTSKPKAAVVMPSPIKSAAVHLCNPYIDPYCLYPLLPHAAAPAEPEPEPAPAPVKAPAPILTPFLPMPLRSHTGYYHYAPVLEPFLNAEQRAELLRICNPEDVECLQYHLRAAYGYRPAPGPFPSYAALKCDPKDPYCMPLLVQKAPTGYYHLMYPGCDPNVDPLCVVNVAAPLTSGEAPKEQHCNPLFDAGCNPLTATKLSGLTKPVLEYPMKDAPADPAPVAAAAYKGAPLSCDPRVDPYCLLTVAAALRRPPPQIPEHQVRYQLGVPGKTKEGYDCYVHYDKDCTPLDTATKGDLQAPPKPFCHPFDPNCGKFVVPPGTASKTIKDGIIFPDPHCDPEYDYNCRLRKVESEPQADSPAPEADSPAPADEQAAPLAEEKQAVADDPSPSSFDEFLKGVISKSQ